MRLCKNGMALCQLDLCRSMVNSMVARTRTNKFNFKEDIMWFTQFDSFETNLLLITTPALLDCLTFKMCYYQQNCGSHLALCHSCKWDKHIIIFRWTCLVGFDTSNSTNLIVSNLQQADDITLKKSWDIYEFV